MSSEVVASRFGVEVLEIVLRRRRLRWFRLVRRRDEEDPLRRVGGLVVEE